MAAAEPFKPALIVVDFQEDFCPPNGSLAVPNGRDIAPTVNALLALPFAVRIATRDWHPPNHVSFATNHPPPDNKPFESTYTITPPSAALRPPSTSPSGQLDHDDTSDSKTDKGSSSSDSKANTADKVSSSSAPYTITLWPPHCIQNTPGAALVPELAAHLLTSPPLDKGLLPDAEMYSAFRDPARLCDSGLADALRRDRVTHVYVVGLAADYCVRATAEHAVEEGFATCIVKEGTRAVDPEGWEARGRGEVMGKGVGLVSVGGSEVERVRALAG